MHNTNETPEQKYERRMKDLKKRYSYHAPYGDQPARYDLIRKKYLELATLIIENTPESREQSTAFTLLDQAMMMTNAAIARNE